VTSQESDGRLRDIKKTKEGTLNLSLTTPIGSTSLGNQLDKPSINKAIGRSLIFQLSAESAPTDEN